MTPTARTSRPIPLAIFLVFAGAIGFIAAFALTLEKFDGLVNPGQAAGCDFSVLVQCTKNLESAQGSTFGFPNPLIGLAGFTAVIAVGVGVLAGARFARWFWGLFNLGLLGALAFVVYLISTSIYYLGTLCPWCMIVWSVTIPSFIAVTLYNAKSGVIPLPGRLRRALGGAYAWTPFIALLCYIAVAVLAQLRLDVIRYL
ncbi:putative membrane protein [Marisediminicola sp. UYEF4]|uniref:vitamin K epoxide reductase family protein n=1 Tax=Marisediminicola sp. UYEF4 TaxID=1756384 RepID=UPI003390A44E